MNFSKGIKLGATSFMLLLIAFAVASIAYSKNPAIFKGENGCKLGFVCGNAYNSGFSDSSLRVSQNWVDAQRRSVGDSDAFAPHGPFTEIPPGSLAPGGADWDAFLAPAGCITKRNGEIVKAGNWFKVSDIDRPVVTVNCRG